MTDASAPSAPGHARTRRTGTVLGGIALTTGLVAAALPTPYIVESPGPAINVLGEFDDKPVLTVEGAETYDSGGNLDMTTVMVSGPPTGSTSVFQVAEALVDGTADIVPRELVYPSTVSAEDVTSGNAAAMTASQDVATAAALTELGIEYHQTLAVAEFAAGSQAEQALEVGDELLEAGGQRITGLAGLKEVLNASEGEDVPMRIRRDGREQLVQVPVYAAAPDSPDRWQIGVYLDSGFDFPVDAQVTLDDIGGPSAGMMFALAIVDEMTPGQMTGGHHVAGTGTIDPDGTVGPIGGIPQKVHGAAAAGAEVFLAPEANCAELQGRIPDGIDVYAVSTLSQARQTVEALRRGEAPQTPTCAEAASGG